MYHLLMLPTLALLGWYFHIVRDDYGVSMPSYNELAWYTGRCAPVILTLRHIMPPEHVYMVNICLVSWVAYRMGRVLPLTGIWDDYPYIPVTPEVQALYGYMIDYTMYSMIRDNRRHPSRMMWVHHCVALSLLLYSYQLNLVRVGIWVLLTHAVTEPFVQLARYYKNVPTVGLLLSSWLVFRLIGFGCFVVPCTLFAPNQHGYYLLNSLLLTLLALDLVWFAMICQKAVLKLKWMGS